MRAPSGPTSVSRTRLPQTRRVRGFALPASRPTRRPFARTVTGTSVASRIAQPRRRATRSSGGRARTVTVTAFERALPSVAVSRCRPAGRRPSASVVPEPTRRLPERQRTVAPVSLRIAAVAVTSSPRRSLRTGVLIRTVGVAPANVSGPGRGRRAVEPVGDGHPEAAGAGAAAREVGRGEADARGIAAGGERRPGRAAVRRGLHGRGERVAVGVGRRDPQRDDAGAPDRGARGGERDARRAPAVELRDDASVDDGLHARHARGGRQRRAWRRHRRRARRRRARPPAARRRRRPTTAPAASSARKRTRASAGPAPGLAGRERRDGEAGGDPACARGARRGRGGDGARPRAAPRRRRVSAADAAFGVNGVMSTGRGSNSDGLGRAVPRRAAVLRGVERAVRARQDRAAGDRRCR